MAKLLSGLFLLLATFASYAQGTPEAPVEHASPATVIAFLALFIGSCVGYGFYLWWGGRKKKQQQAAE